jgi:hypothetical protein
VQPFADRYGYGNKTRKLFHLSDVVWNLLTADESNVSARLFGCAGSLARPLRRLQGPRNEELEVIEDVIPLFNVNVGGEGVPIRCEVIVVPGETPLGCIAHKSLEIFERCRLKRRTVRRFLSRSNRRLRYGKPDVSLGFSHTAAIGTALSSNEIPQTWNTDMEVSVLSFGASSLGAVFREVNVDECI